MTTQIRVGIFTLLAVLGIFVAYYFIENVMLRHTGYQIGVHFHDVGGLQEGSSVLMSGVQVGEVSSVRLLPDASVEVICTMNPDTVVYRDSVFTVFITFTGATTLSIRPPASHQVAMIMPEHVLPVDQQPWGTLPPNLTDLVSAGQEQLKALEKTLVVVNKQLPALLTKFTDVAYDSDRLIRHADSDLAGLSSQLDTTVALLTQTVTTSSRNIDELTGNLNGLVRANRTRLTALVDSLAKTADNLNKTMAGMSSIAQDPLLHSSLIGTAQNVEQATAKLKAIATDIQSITGDPKTQSELRGAIGNLSAASAKANDILGSFTSGQTGGAPAASPTTGGIGPSPGSPPPTQGGTRRRFSGQSLVTAQVRETWSNRGGGPASDLDLVLLPGASTHLTFGANDLGYNSSYNFLLDKAASPNLQIGGGVLYSKLGIAALFRPFGGPIGVDARLYDPKHPTLDLYGDLRLTQRLQLFYGERSIWGTSAKTPSFGLQINY